MKLAKWGNSYGIRVTAELMEQLKWSPNDELQPSVQKDGTLRIMKDQRREKALETLRKHRVNLPERYVFDRDEIYGE